MKPTDTENHAARLNNSQTLILAISPAICAAPISPETWSVDSRPAKMPTI